MNPYTTVAICLYSLVHYHTSRHNKAVEKDKMKYAITENGKIHQVTDEKLFYSFNPNATDVTHIKGIYAAYERQQHYIRQLAAFGVKSCQ